MGEYNSVADEIKANKSKMKGKTLPQKIGFFLYYYKWPCVAVVASLLLILFLIGSFLTDAKRPYVTGIFINSYATDLVAESYEEDYASLLTDSLGKEKVTFDFSLSYHSDGSNSKEDLNTPIMVIAYSEADEGDFFICDEANFDHFAQSGFFIDVKELLDDALYVSFADSDGLHYMTYADGSSSPVGLILTKENAPYLWAEGIYTDETPVVIYSFFYNSQHKERAVDYLRFLLTWRK